MQALATLKKSVLAGKRNVVGSIPWFENRTLWPVPGDFMSWVTVGQGCVEGCSILQRLRAQIHNRNFGCMLSLGKGGEVEVVCVCGGGGGGRTAM